MYISCAFSEGDLFKYDNTIYILGTGISGYVGKFYTTSTQRLYHVFGT